MNTKAGAQVPETPAKKRHNRVPNNGKGRPKGATNKVTKATVAAAMQAAFMQQKETCQEIFKNILGLEMPAPDKIDGGAVKNRKYLADVLAGKVEVSPQWVAVLRLSLAYAYGTPLKAEPDKSQKQRMPYIGRNGLPWEYDVMAEQERLAIEAQKDQEKIDAAARERKLSGAPDDPKPDEEDDGGETLEVVRG